MAESPPGGLDIEQSLPICIALSVIGGLLEVAATACTAVPSVRAARSKTKQGWYWKYLALAGNITLQTAGSLASHLVGTWFGPISIVVPFFYSSTLLCNMLIFGALLGLEFFTKTAKTGTLVIVVSIVLLPIVGPGVQEDQDITVLISKPYSFIWFGLLILICTITGLLVCFVDIKSRFTQRKVAMILLLTRASSISINLTVSKGFASNLDPTSWLFGFFLVLKISTGWIYTYAIVVQSTAIQHQSKFVPLNTTCIITLNALTGILIWEDYKVVASWYGYACVFCLLGLGCDLLLDTDVPLLTDDNPDFGVHRRASIVDVLGKRRRRESILKEAYGYNKTETDKLLSIIAEYDDESDDEENVAAAAAATTTTESVEKKDGKLEDGIPEVVSVEKKLSPKKSPAVSGDKDERGEEGEEADDYDGDEFQRGQQQRALSRREAWQFAIGIPKNDPKPKNNDGSMRGVGRDNFYGAGGGYGSIFNADRPYQPQPEEVARTSDISSVTLEGSNKSFGGIINKALTSTGEKFEEGARKMATATTNLFSNTGNKVKDSESSLASSTKKSIHDPFEKAFKGIGSVFKQKSKGGGDETSSKNLL